MCLSFHIYMFWVITGLLCHKNAAVTVELVTWNHTNTICSKRCTSSAQRIRMCAIAVRRNSLRDLNSCNSWITVHKLVTIFGTGCTLMMWLKLEFHGTPIPIIPPQRLEWDFQMEVGIPGKFRVEFSLFPEKLFEFAIKLDNFTLWI